MSTSRSARRWRTGLAILLTGSAVGGTMAALGEVAAGSQSSPVIKSGAGPGWPRTLMPSDFVARIDNTWFPLLPGSVYHYRGIKDRTRIVDVLRVTHRKKKILGVRTTVVHDEVLIHGKPEEVTDDYYAQDRHGNVWYFGERTKELNRRGKVISTEGSFQAGRHGARAGLYIPGHPKVGSHARQEYYKGHAEDHFRVLDRSAKVSVPYRSSRHALRTREWTPLEPNVVDNKYYLRGVGTVREIAVKGPVERLRLVTFKRG